MKKSLLAAIVTASILGCSTAALAQDGLEPRQVRTYPVESTQDRSSLPKKKTNQAQKPPAQKLNSYISEKKVKPGVMKWMTLAPEDKNYLVSRDANYRVGPNTAFHSKGVLKEGDAVRSVGRAGSWIAFMLGSDVMFVWDGLLEVDEIRPQVTVY